MTGRTGTSQSKARLWRVFRIDDNGNRFEVATELSAETADRLLRDYTAKGHKQTYFKEKHT